MVVWLGELPHLQSDWRCKGIWIILLCSHHVLNVLYQSSVVSKSEYFLIIGEVKGRILILPFVHYSIIFSRFKLSFVVIFPPGTLSSAVDYSFHMVPVFFCLLFINMKHRNFKCPFLLPFFCFVVFFVLTAGIIHGFSFVEEGKKRTIKDGCGFREPSKTLDIFRIC